MAEGVWPREKINEPQNIKPLELRSLTKDVTDTKVGNLDPDSTLSISLAEDVGRLQVIVEDCRMLTMEERQSSGELPDQPPDIKLGIWLVWIGRQVVPQRSSVAVLHHNGELSFGVLEKVEVGHDVLMLELDEDHCLLLGHFCVSKAEESFHSNLVSFLSVGFLLLQGAETNTPKGSRPESFDFLEVSILRVVVDYPEEFLHNTRVSHSHDYLIYLGT